MRITGFGHTIQIGRSHTGAASSYAASISDAFASLGIAQPGLLTPDYVSKTVSWPTLDELKNLRRLYRFNPYSRRLTQLTRNNVVGAQGLVLEVVRRDAPSQMSVQQNWLEWTAKPLVDDRRSWLDFGG